MIQKIKNIAKYVLKKDYRWRVQAASGKYEQMDDRTYIERQYYSRFQGKKKLNLDAPKTVGDKLNWLKLYDRKPYYWKLVDKYEVKKYVADKIGSEYVIPALGVWDNPEDIDFDILPNQFVLKCTHDSGSIIVCKDKKKIDKKEVCSKLNESLKHNHYKENREWAYKNVKPRVIAEQYVESLGKADSVEYKLSCGNGKVGVITVCIGIPHSTLDVRTNDHFDEEWNRLPFYAVYKNSNKDIARPKQMDDLIKFSKILSEGIPHLRVDWYVVDGHIYFGEMTFYTWAGYMQMVPDEWDTILGDMIELPPVTIE